MSLHDDDDEQEDLRDYARGLIKDPPQVQPTVSISVLGEIHLVCLVKKHNPDRVGEAIATLHKWIHNGHIVVAPPLPTAFQHARRLREEDTLLTPTDTMVIAHAIADKASALYSTDRYALNGPVRDYAATEGTELILVDNARTPAKGGNKRSSAKHQR